MSAESRAERYTKVAAAEIESGNMRFPIWTDAMIVAKGDVKTAREVYTVRRVQQMEEDEDRREQAEGTRIARQKSEEQIKRPRWISKTLLLLLFAVAFAVLYLILSFVRSGAI